jgi:hypothetical protein
MSAIDDTTAKRDAARAALLSEIGNPGTVVMMHAVLNAYAAAERDLYAAQLAGEQSTELTDAEQLLRKGSHLYGPIIAAELDRLRFRVRELDAQNETLQGLRGFDRNCADALADEGQVRIRRKVFGDALLDYRTPPSARADRLVKLEARVRELEEALVNSERGTVFVWTFAQNEAEAVEKVASGAMESDKAFVDAEQADITEDGERVYCIRITAALAGRTDGDKNP